MIVLIDNYDSFSYNVYQLIGSIEPNIKVFRNDAITVAELAELSPDAIILSPGPGRPEDAGICQDVVVELGSHIPILGICLGHQAIVQAYGGHVGYAKELMHGKSSLASVSPESILFKHLPQEITVGRYHSLAADVLSEDLLITSKTSDDEVMAVEHKTNPVFGLQFHPESSLTPHGGVIIKKFLYFAKEFNGSEGK
jgi:anthranilate synthase component 2